MPNIMKWHPGSTGYIVNPIAEGYCITLILGNLARVTHPLSQILASGFAWWCHS